MVKSLYVNQLFFLDVFRVMILAGGSIVEYDNPAELMKHNTSLFYSMAKDAGLV